MPKLRSFYDWLIESLKDPKEAEAYIKAALSSNDPELLQHVISDVIEAGNNSVVISLKLPQKSEKSRLILAAIEPTKY